MSIIEENIDEGPKPKKWLGERHIQLFMTFLGILITHCMRTTMSIAIVDMTDPTNDNYFDWSLKKQSVILSSFSWGYVVLQIVSGELIAKFGGKTFMIICVGVNAVFTLLVPVAAVYGGWITICVCRGIQGLAQGSVFPTVMYLIAKWAHRNERGRVASFILSGGYLGIACQLIVAGYLANYWGWPSIFYVNGAVGVIWTIVYWFIGSDNPQCSKSISAEERYYIQSSLGHIGGHKNLKTPWKSILTSAPFLSALIANVGYSWGYWTLLNEIPTYFSKVLQVDIKSNGIMSALPYITIFAMNFPVGYASDYMIRKNCVSLTACRKIFNTIAFFGVALSLFCLTYIPTGNVTLAVVTLCVALGLSSGYYSGYIIVFLDMAQNFSSVLLAISNGMGNLISLFAPLVVGFIVKDENDPEGWFTVFYVSSMIYIVTNIIFLMFATSKEQKWNEGIEISKETIKA